jgi:hypothetical protein
MDEEQWEPYNGPRYMADNTMICKKRGPRRRTRYAMEMNCVKQGRSIRAKGNTVSVEDRVQIRCSKCHKAGHNQRSCKDKVCSYDFLFTYAFLCIAFFLAYISAFHYIIFYDVMTNLNSISQDGAVPAPGAEVRAGAPGSSHRGRGGNWKQIVVLSLFMFLFPICNRLTLCFHLNCRFFPYFG